MYQFRTRPPALSLRNDIFGEFSSVTKMIDLWTVILCNLVDI
jgi:hypothetical protein